MINVVVRRIVPCNFLISTVNGKSEHHKQAYVDQTVARVSKHISLHTVTLLDVAGAWWMRSESGRFHEKIQVPVVKADDILNKSRLITSTRFCSIFSRRRFDSTRFHLYLLHNRNTRHTPKTFYHIQPSISFNIKFHYYCITWTH
jgi:hypothetical protein